MQWTKNKSAEYYNGTWQWIEDTYLSYFGDNRTSYGIKDTASKTEVTGNKDVDNMQRSAGNLVGDTVGANGLAAGVGNAVDKGFLRGNVWTSMLHNS